MFFLKRRYAALPIVLAGYGLEVNNQKQLPVYFRKSLVGEFKADIIVNDVVIV
jgi:hypothetical protein